VKTLSEFWNETMEVDLMHSKAKIVCQPDFSFITNHKFPQTYPGQPPDSREVKVFHSSGD